MLALVLLWCGMAVADPNIPAPTTAEIKACAVNGETGDPVVGADIMYSLDGGSATLLGQTDANGCVEDDTLAPGDYEFWASYNQAESPVTDLTLAAGDSSQIELVIGGKLVVNAYRGDGVTPVEGVTVMIETEDGDTSQLGITNFNGRVFAQQVPVGVHEVWVEYNGIACPRKTTCVSFAVGGVPSPLDFAVEGRLVIWVLQADDSPVEGAVIKFKRDGGAEEIFGISDPWGGYYRNDLIPGAYEFYVCYDGIELPIVKSVNICCGTNPQITFYVPQISLDISSTDGGSVTDPGEGVFAYEYGDLVPVTAVPDSKYVFVKWMGTAVDNGLVLDPNAAVTAVDLETGSSDVLQSYTLIAHFCTKPKAYTTMASPITERTAFVWGDVLDDGGCCSTGVFRFKNVSAGDPWNVQVTACDKYATGESFGLVLTGLVPGATYKFSAALKNPAGQSGWGGDITFKTLPYTVSDGCIKHLQSAIDMAVDGTTIIVEGGTLRESVDLGSKELYIFGSGMPTLIGDDASPTLMVAGGQSNKTIIRGLRILGGAAAGIHCDGSNPIIENCIVTGSRGNGMVFVNSKAKVRNCTVAENSALVGQAAVTCIDSPVMITNSIIAANRPEGVSIAVAGAAPAVTYCNVEGGWDGDGNIADNPLFSELGDLRLMSEEGRWDGSAWVVDAMTSPCVDAGDPSANVGSEPAPNGGIINMGAFGGTDQASMTPPPPPEPEPEPEPTEEPAG